MFKADNPSFYNILLISQQSGVKPNSLYAVIFMFTGTRNDEKYVFQDTNHIFVLGNCAE